VGFLRPAVPLVIPDFRALEVYHQHGIEMSNILKSQKTESGEESLRGPVRYDNTCIIWIQTEKKGMTIS
jgi:hypothetical protein